MPRLNQLCQAAMGIGDGPCSVDRRLVLPVGGGPAQWLATDLLLVNTKVDGPQQVLAVFVGDPTQRSILREGGANDLVAAGAGLWLGWAPGVGLFGTDIGLTPEAAARAGVVAAGFDGTLAYCPDRQNGIGVVLRAPDGSKTAIPSAAPIALGFFQVLSATSAVWTDAFTGLTTFGRAPFKAALPVGLCRVARVRGEDWLVYWSEGTGLVAQVDEALDGYILETAPTAFNHDAGMYHGPTGEELLVVWSLTSGEGPDDLVTRPVDRSQPRVPLVPPLVLPTFHFTHPVIVAPFKDPENQSGAPSEILVNMTAQHSLRPLFIAEDTLEAEWDGPLLGVYSEAPDPRAVLQVAATLETRLLLCHDSIADWDLPVALLRPWDIPMLELYRHEAETLEDSVGRWDVQLTGLLNTWPGDVAVCPMFYCQGGAPPDEVWTVQQVLDTLPYLSPLVNRSPRVKVISPFAWLRANGITGHPELRAAHDRLVAAGAAAGLATLLPVGNPDPPDPPDPPSFPRHTGVPMDLDGKTLVLRGPGGRLARPDAPNTGPWAHLGAGWRGLVYDGRDSQDARYHFTRREADKALIHAQLQSALGSDATKFSGGLNAMNYCKPDGDTAVGFAEQWEIYDGNANGALEAQVEYRLGAGADDGPFFGFPFAVEVVA